MIEYNMNITWGGIYMDDILQCEIEKRICVENFQISRMREIIPFMPVGIKNNLDKLSDKFTSSEIEKIQYSLIRQAFLIELVNDQITSTKFEVRWTKRLTNDIRFASCDECLRIFDKLLNTVINASTEEIQIIKLFLNCNMVPYELPIDYIERIPEDNKPLHCEENISFFFTKEIKAAILLRNILTDKELNPAAKAFKEILNKKLKIKTYLTDRAQTGAHKTNREKRWETHPESVQFSLRRDCINIEKSLLLEICSFEGAPNELIEYLINNNLMCKPSDFHRCPVTLDIIKYNDFINDVISPTHGKSKFQVGHLYPLKAGNSRYGHRANNISWISEDGNRIQGSLSLDEVNNLLDRIFKNKAEVSNK